MTYSDGKIEDMEYANDQIQTKGYLWQLPKMFFS